MLIRLDGGALVVALGPVELVTVLPMLERLQARQRSQGVIVPDAFERFVADARRVVVLGEFGALANIGQRVADAAPVERESMLTVTEAAKLTHRSARTIRRLAATGRVSGVSRTSSGWLIPADALNEGELECNKPTYKPLLAS
jgi:excisionase family DNA binding protein